MNNQVSLDTSMMRKTIYISIVMMIAATMISSLELLGLEQQVSPDTINISEITSIPALEQIGLEPIAGAEPIPGPTPVVETPSPTPQPTATAQPVATGSHTDWMVAAGISESDYKYVDFIVNHESSWRVTATNSLGCVGLIQACPAGLKPRLLAECPDWENDPACQLRVASGYAIGRYKSWQGAYNFWSSARWW